MEISNETSDIKMTDVTEYRLSQVLSGHSAPVRCCATASTDEFVTGGTKGQFIVWTKGEDGKFFGNEVFQSPAHNLSFCVKSLPSGSYISGGNTFEGAGELLVWNKTGEIQARVGHDQAVISVATNGELCVTGSFDSKGRIFKMESVLTSPSSVELTGHKYGVEVCVLSNNIITGAYKDIHIWNLSGKLVKSIRLAHDHQIRKIIPHPLGFASCGNDGFIRVWLVDGTKVSEIQAHPAMGDKPSFVYGLCIIPDGRIVSTGEDSRVKIWGTDGTLFQAIAFPSVVRDLDCLPNGDIITASTDSSVRIWTTNPDRYASQEEIVNFQEFVELANSNMKEIDDSQLESEDVLQKPGKEGEVKLIKTSKGPYAYQYSGGVWVEIGEAMGAAADSRPNIDGVPYDFVTDLYLDETTQVKLGFNKDDDPKKTLEDFCAKYAITDDGHKSQILSHLEKQVDPLARAKRMQEEAVVAANRLRHTPIHKRYRAHLFADKKFDKMEDAVINNNTALCETEFYIERSDIDAVFVIVKDTAHYHSSEFPKSCRKTVIKMVQTPTDKVLPILDLLRVLMLHGQAVTMLDEAEVRTSLSSHMNSPNCKPSHRRLLCQILANYLNKRNATHAEDPNLVGFLQIAVCDITSLVEQTKTPYLRDYTAFLTNLLIWLGRFNIPIHDIAPDIMASLSHCAMTMKNNKFLFFALLNISTIGYLAPDEQEIIVASFGGLNEMKEAIRGIITASGANPQCEEVAEDMWRVFIEN